MEGKCIEQNGISIDKKKANRMIMSILFNENLNHKTKAKSDSDMVKLHMETIKEELNAYQEN